MSFKRRLGSIVFAVVVLQHIGMGRSHTAVTCNHHLLRLLLLMRHHLLLQDLLLVLVLVRVCWHHARWENLTVQRGGRMVAIGKNLLMLIELLL